MLCARIYHDMFVLRVFVFVFLATKFSLSTAQELTSVKPLSLDGSQNDDSPTGSGTLTIKTLLPRNAMLVRYMLSSCVRLSVRHKPVLY